MEDRGQTDRVTAAERNLNPNPNHNSEFHLIPPEQVVTALTKQ